MYNLNAVKYFNVTDSFLGLDQNVKECQNKEALEECKTRHYIDGLLQQCECLPFRIRINKKVSVSKPKI